MYFKELLELEAPEEWLPSPTSDSRETEVIENVVEPLEKEEVAEVLASLKNYKAPGEDEVLAELLKHGRDVLMDALYHLIYDICMA